MFWLANETWMSVPHHLEPRRHAFPAGQHIDVLFPASLKVGRGHSTSHSRRVVVAASYRVGELDNPVGQWGRRLHPGKRDWHNGWDIFTMYSVRGRLVASYSGAVLDMAAWVIRTVGLVGSQTSQFIDGGIVLFACCNAALSGIAHKSQILQQKFVCGRFPWPVPAMISELHNFPGMFRARVDLIAHVRLLRLFKHQCHDTALFPWRHPAVVGAHRTPYLDKTLQYCGLASQHIVPSYVPDTAWSVAAGDRLGEPMASEIP